MQGITSDIGPDVAGAWLGAVGEAASRTAGLGWAELRVHPVKEAAHRLAGVHPSDGLGEQAGDTAHLELGPVEGAGPVSVVTTSVIIG